MDGPILGDNQLSGRYNHLAITDHNNYDSDQSQVSIYLPSHRWVPGTCWYAYWTRVPTSGSYHYFAAVKLAWPTQKEYPEVPALESLCIVSKLQKNQLKCSLMLIFS